MGPGLGNYTISYVNGTLNVTPALLTITAKSLSKTYGQTATLGGSAFTTSGLLNSDSVSSVTETSTGAAATAPVAGYAIIPSAAMGTGLGNYTIGYVNGTLNVTPASLAVTANNQSIAIGSALPALTFTSSALVNGDGNSVFTGALATTATSTSSSGNYPITQGTLSAGPNYAIAFTPGTLTIAQAATILPGSIYVLDASAAGSLTLLGNAHISLGNAALFVDSKSSSAILASGNSVVSAASVQVVGGVSKSGNASVTKTGTPASTTDPLAGLAQPTPPTYSGSAISEVLSGNANTTINPGLYSQITVSGNAKLTLSPGIYVVAGGGFAASGNAVVSASGVSFIIEGGGFSQSGNAIVNGSGMTIFNAGSKYGSSGSGGSYGEITLSGNGSLTPPTTGAYSGVLIFQSRDNTQTLSLTGNSAPRSLGHDLRPRCPARSERQRSTRQRSVTNVDRRR